VDGGSDVGTWESCTATGQFTAHCDWRSTWNDATKTVDRHGTVDATISADGKTIQCVSYEQTNAGTSYQNPGDVIWKNKSGPWYLSSMNSGAVWNSTFSRR
jgi:hypothetical protein